LKEEQKDQKFDFSKLPKIISQGELKPSELLRELNKA
jgi:hypothetical protein